MARNLGNSFNKRVLRTDARGERSTGNWIGVGIEICLACEASGTSVCGGGSTGVCEVSGTGASRECSAGLCNNFNPSPVTRPVTRLAWEALGIGDCEYVNGD